jgi:hypothetical protein
MLQGRAAHVRCDPLQVIVRLEEHLLRNAHLREVLFRPKARIRFAQLALQ